MGSEGHEHQDNKNEYTVHGDGTRESNAENTEDDNNNEISSIMNKQYGKRTRKIYGLGKENVTSPQRYAYTHQ